MRPSTIGFEEVGGLGGMGYGSGSGSIGHSSVRPKMDWNPLLGRVQRACEKHGKGQISADLALQFHEIADIGLAGESPNKPLSSCVVEALWKEVIPPSSSHPSDWSKKLTWDFSK